jgi:phage-related baseplate assembly protein
MDNKYNLPDPTAIEEISFESIVDENIAFTQALIPDWKPTESDPWMIAIESFSYKELYLRMKMNEDKKKMLPHLSSGSDLENFIFGFYGGITRLEGESDEEFLDRAMLSLNRFTTAGSRKSYEYHTYSADARIDDVKVINALKPLSEYVNLFVGKDEAGVLEALKIVMGDQATVEVYIASEYIIDEELLEIVREKLNQDEIIPTTDRVRVADAPIKDVIINATLELHDLNNKDHIEAQIKESFKKFFKIGEDVIYSDVISKLHINGVYKVSTNISDDVVVSDTEVAKLSLNLDFVQAVMK